MWRMGQKVQRIMTPGPSFKVKAKRGVWTAETMELALEKIWFGEITQWRATTHFSIPESTIWSWKAKKVTSKRLGAPTALSPEEETALVNWCLKLQDVACCISLLMLKTKVKQLCANCVTRFRSGMPGKKCWKYFSKRHPELVLHTPQGLDGKRAKTVSLERCSQFYNFLARTFERQSYSAAHIWNMDETGISASMDIGGAKVIAKKGS